MFAVTRYRLLVESHETQILCQNMYIFSNLWKNRSEIFIFKLWKLSDLAFWYTRTHTHTQDRRHLGSLFSFCGRTEILFCFCQQPTSLVGGWIEKQKGLKRPDRFKPFHYRSSILTGLNDMFHRHFGRLVIFLMIQQKLNFSFLY